MLTVVKNIINNLKFFVTAIKCSMKSAMEYKISFLVQSIFMFINNGFWLVFWLVIFKVNGDNINGVTFDTILYLWSLPVISFGIAYFFFGGSDNINKYIISGQMDSYMLQPKHPLLNILTSKCNFSAFGDLMYGIVLGLIVVKFNLVYFLLILILGTFGAIFYVSTAIILRSISVWLGDTELIAKKYSDSLLTTFSIYPEQLFSGILKVLLYTVIPVGYMAYMPINVVMSFDVKSFLCIIGVGVMYIILALLLFNKAMRSYESGNTISMRN
ncbi:MAG: ABC-2 family transporter protein [Clostridia bacterium]|nr:ABC-2 family transporter protein [Clostridia bacterium]MDD4387443.1 ABC-2 family transporter protein [Clostridia bacterium]